MPKVRTRKETRQWSRRTGAHLFLGKHKNHNSLLNNHRQKKKPPKNTLLLLFSHWNLPKMISNFQGQRSHNKMVRGAQLSSVAQLYPTLCDPMAAACQTSLSITNSRSLLKLMSIELMIPSNHLILCRPLLLLPSIFPSIRVFSSESVLPIRWPKFWSFSFISPSNEYSGLISFRID